jgi:hypothetical protein
MVFGLLEGADDFASSVEMPACNFNVVFTETFLAFGEAG